MGGFPGVGARGPEGVCGKWGINIFFSGRNSHQVITRMKLLFSNYLGGYSYSFQGPSELISITVTVSLFF